MLPELVQLSYRYSFVFPEIAGLGMIALKQSICIQSISDPDSRAQKILKSLVLLLFFSKNGVQSIR